MDPFPHPMLHRPNQDAEHIHRQRQHKFSRRHFLYLSAANLVAASLTLTVGAACTPPVINTEAEPAREPAQLVYQDWRTDWFPAMAQEMLAKFHERHPRIRVFFTPDPENVADAMLTDMAAGTAPDLFQGCCTYFPIWAQKGYTLDLRTYVSRDIGQETIADWDPAQYRSFFLPDGYQFGLPKYHGTVALYFNKDLFDAAGVAYPTADWTYEAYLDAMQRLTMPMPTDDAPPRRGSMVDIVWDRVQMYVNSWGGHLVEPGNPLDCAMGEPAALAAMRWLHERIWTDQSMATYIDVQNMSTRSAFVNQRVAMIEEGSWALKEILTYANFRVGVAPFPAGPEHHVALTTTDGYGIYQNTEHPEEAWELMQFLTSAEYGLAMATANYLQPARASLAPDWIEFVRTQAAGKITAADMAAFVDGQMKGYSVTVEIAADMADAQRRAADAWESIFILNQAPVSQMIEVCRKIQNTQRLRMLAG
ncbi:MAG: sugar ABC transporter substrate-binding protein [Caldilineaceae bacterium]|nr:sugar ABC transporter substrate-binding protein [Caldilineaceae bacterium]